MSITVWSLHRPFGVHGELFTYSSKKALIQVSPEPENHVSKCIHDPITPALISANLEAHLIYFADSQSFTIKHLEENELKTCNFSYLLNINIKIICFHCGSHCIVRPCSNLVNQVLEVGSPLRDDLRVAHCLGGAAHVASSLLWPAGGIQGSISSGHSHWSVASFVLGGDAWETSGDCSSTLV